MTQVKVILVCLLNALVYKQIQSYQFSGDGTAYGGGEPDNGQINGYCGFTKLPKFHVALNSQQWNNSLDCGRCVSISYKDSEPITAMVTNICPECKSGDLDLHADLYKELIKQSPGREKISWEFVNCPNSMIEENIKLKVHSINYYWLAITPVSMKCGIAKMEISFDNEWIEMDRNDDSTGKKNKMNGLYFIYHSFVKSPFQLKLTSRYGDVITTPKYDKLEDVLLTNQQFQCDGGIEGSEGDQTEQDCNLPMPTMQPATPSPEPSKVDETPLCVCP